MFALKERHLAPQLWECQGSPQSARIPTTPPMERVSLPLPRRLAATLRELLEGVMNFDSETVAFSYDDSKTIPKRRFRRRMGLCRPLSGPRSRRRPSQRNHDLREVFNGLRWIVRTGSAWRYMPHDLPPWEAVYQQTRRWLEAGVFKEMVHDLRLVLRLSEGRASEPTAAILDCRRLTSTGWS